VTFGFPSLGSFAGNWAQSLGGETDIVFKDLGGATGSDETKLVFSFLDIISPEGNLDGGGGMLICGGGGGMLWCGRGGGSMFLDGGGVMMLERVAAILLGADKCDGMSTRLDGSIPSDTGWTLFRCAIDELLTLPNLPKPVLTKSEPCCEFWKDEQNKKKHFLIKLLCGRLYNQ
jgi:hypothetical protein